MITIQVLTYVIIPAFCGFKDPKISQEKKLDCAEFMANCTIIEDGKTTNKQIDKCREEWLSK